MFTPKLKTYRKTLSEDLANAVKDLHEQHKRQEMASAMVVMLVSRVEHLQGILQSAPDDVLDLAWVPA